MKSLISYNFNPPGQPVSVTACGRARDGRLDAIATPAYQHPISHNLT